MTTQADPRRLIPRTDQLLALPGVRAGAVTAGRARGPRPGARHAGPGPARRPRARRRSRSTVLAARRRAGGDVAAAGAQRDRRGGAHEPRPGAALGRPRSRRWSRRADMSMSNSTWPPAPGRSAGSPRGEALLAACPAAEDALVVNNGAAALVLATTALAAGRRGGGEPRGADRDRRRVPAARPDRLHRRAAARGRHHQPDPPARLRRRDRARHRLRAQGASQQLHRVEGFTAAVSLAGVARPAAHAERQPCRRHPLQQRRRADDPDRAEDATRCCGLAHHLLQPAAPTGHRTDLAGLIRAGAAHHQRRSLVVVISDFISEPGWERSLSLLSRAPRAGGHPARRSA